MPTNKTHSMEQISELEAQTGLVFSGYMEAGDDKYKMLVPVLLKGEKSLEERTAKVIRLSKGI